MIKLELNILRKIYIAIALFIMLTAMADVFADSMSSAFGKRSAYRSSTSLGDPRSMSKFADHNANVSDLEGLNDSSLIDKGSNALRTDSLGQKLQNAEERKIEAIERYKINDKTPWLKNSYKLEEDPLAKTGGKGLSSTTTVTKTKINKSCIEGVDFNVDVGLELVLEVEEEEYKGPLQTKTINIPYREIPAHWWIEGRHQSSNSNGSIDMPEWTINHAYNEEMAVNIANKLDIPLDQLQVGPQDIILTLMPAPYSRNADLSNCKKYWLGVFRYPDNAIITFTYTSQETLKKLVEKAEYWQVSTEGTERLAEANECYETGRVCLKSGVKTFLDKYDISRPCWYEKITYRCKSEPKGGCAHLIKQDCQLKDSECEYRIGSICLRWKRDFVCGGQKKELRYSLADSPIYCLGGDCHEPTIEENQDFANVAYLAALNEAKKDCEKEPSGLCKDPITIFPGKSDSCKKIIVGLIDCCSSMKGWGKNANLCRCSGSEKGLAMKRDKGLCHRVGTYCHQKDPVFGTCLVKKTSHCCFGSKLARIFQEQARKQLGISWGSTSSPNCRPITLDEFKRIDFSKIDLEELFADILALGKSKMDKAFPNLNPGEIPPIQKEHMKTTASEKREIRRREEEERRLALERERLERERLERERLAKEAREREIRLAQDQRRSHLTQLKRTKTSELAKASSEVTRLARECDNAHHIMMDQYSRSSHSSYADVYARMRQVVGYAERDKKRIASEITAIEEELPNPLPPESLTSKKRAKERELQSAKYHLARAESDQRKYPNLNHRDGLWYWGKEVKRLEKEIREEAY